MKLHAILYSWHNAQLTKFRFNPVTAQANLLPMTCKRTLRQTLDEGSFLEFSIVGVVISSGKRSVTLVI